ncbi:thrombospondin [Polymorphospora lycopeni]|uniref:Thrombospondin n=1 Tax=Polymorphospora lycopeni TaxID=3140240 RepID=A0ABV5CYS9_9ACTN
MVRIPSFARREETAPTRDDERPAGSEAPTPTATMARPAPADAAPAAGRPGDEATTYRSRSATGAAPTRPRTETRKPEPVLPPAPDRRSDQDEMARTDRIVTEDLSADRRDTGGAGAAVVDRTPETEEERPVAPTGPRPRTSLLATISLILGVAGILFVLTGALAGYGIGIGAVGALLGVAGISATARRHISGKTEALLGLALGLAAVVIGILAMTGQFAWPTTDGDTVVRFREWLDTQFIERF